MRKLLAIISIALFVSCAVLWIVQCYRPIVLKNTFSNDYFSVRPVGYGLDDFVQFDSAVVSVAGKSKTREGEYIFKVRREFADLLPPVGQHSLVEITDGRLYLRKGTTDVPPEDYPNVGPLPARRFKITRERSYPLWPPLLVFGAISAGIFLRWAVGRRTWMLSTFRASVPRKGQVLVAFALLVVSVCLYLIQLRRPVVLYNGFKSPTGDLALDRNLNWHREKIMATCKAIGTHGSRPNVITISVLPEELHTLLPAVGEHWVLAIGADALQLRSGSVKASNTAANPAWSARHVSSPLAVRFSLPLWLCILASGAWFVYLAVMPSRRYLQRKRRGLCLACGYDLRESPERCPECGQEAGGRKH